MAAANPPGETEGPGSKLPPLPLPREPAHESLSERAAKAVKVELLSDVTQVAPGASSWVALHFTIAPGWHLYWRNPGDSGAPISWTFALP